MPFMKASVSEQIELMRENDPVFKKAWDESRTEYRLIGEKISFCKRENIPQEELCISASHARFLAGLIAILCWMLSGGAIKTTM